jgi:hypothetical protein
MPAARFRIPLALALLAALSLAGPAGAAETKRLGPGPESWTNDLSPIGSADWSYDRAAHLLERAGFGGTPEQIAQLAALTPQQAVDYLVDYEKIDNSMLPAFDESGVWDEGIDPFPPSRPATTDLAQAKGEALGVKVKPAGNRRMQPVVNKFFYWLRASRLEVHRVAYWWGNRMLRSPRQLEESMSLFWHGHFATTEDKVRDYRKMLAQLNSFYRYGTGNFRDLMIAVAEGPAMLAFLDAGVNLKDAPNENFAREIMELFTMGVGNYTEQDIREGARAFTGWNYKGLQFVVNAEQHDNGNKTFLGRTGNFDGVQAIDTILAQPVTARYLSAKMYRYFVRQEIDAGLNEKLAQVFRARYEIKPLLRAMFLSRDFYSPPAWGTYIKGPAQLAVSTYRKFGMTEVPGVPDFNDVTESLGQHLFYPPTVAGWAQGRSWITPGLLLERGNFARDVLFPDINFIPHDRYPEDDTIRLVSERLAQGYDISSATMPPTALIGSMGASAGDKGNLDGGMAMSNQMADRNEDFNTRFASFRGWQMAIQKVKPIPRHAAQIDLTAMVERAGLKSTDQVVDYFLGRFVSVPIAAEQRQWLIGLLNKELGTAKIAEADSYMEDSLRMLLHLILSTPEYQLG